MALTPLTRPEMAAVNGGDDSPWSLLAAPAGLQIIQAGAQLLQWLIDNPPGAGNYAYCKTGLP